MVVWLTIIYVSKGIVILYGLFLAYETRNVIYAHLNDSRVIGICVYNVVVLSVVGAFLSLILDYKNYKEMYIVMSICIIFPAVTTICLMMFPKVSYYIQYFGVRGQLWDLVDAIVRLYVTSWRPITKHSSLASLVCTTNMDAASLYFKSPGIDCNPKIPRYLKYTDAVAMLMVQTREAISESM